MTKIKQHTIQSGEMILMVSVPSNAYNIEIQFNHQLGYTQDEPYKDGILRCIGAELLPTGNWHLIGLSDEITEGQARPLVDSISAASLGVFYKNYDIPLMGNSPVFLLETALESFKSLMQSLGCEGRYAVLKSIK